VPTSSPGSQKTPSTVHAIVGDKSYDSFLAEEALEQILAQAVGEDRSTVEVLRGEETTWSRVLDAARTGSLFAARRAVVVRNADALKGEAEDLGSYLQNPSPGVSLVLLAAKPDRRRVVWKRLLDSASVVKAEPPKGQRLRAYVIDQLRRRKLAIGEQAIEEVLERVGQDLRRLMGELDKLEAFAYDAKGPLSAEDVAAVLGKGLAQPLYRLGDAFAAQRSEDVFALMEKSLEEGEPPLRILATLHRVLRQLRGAQALRLARVPREQLASRLQVPPFKIADLMASERRWSEARLRRAFAALGQADVRIKTGAEPRTALESAVTEACSRDENARPSQPGR
jgi:DNA polymerase-3 subunit delta